MSSVNRWTAADRELWTARYEQLQARHRSTPEPAQRGAAAKWVADTAGVDLSKVLAWVDDTAPVKEREIRQAAGYHFQGFGSPAAERPGRSDRGRSR